MTIKQARLGLTAVLISSVLVGCGGSGKKLDALEEARAAYLNASGNETVVRHAVDDLDQAKLALKRADKLWKDGESGVALNHNIYLVNQRVRIAELVSRRNEDTRKLEDMKVQRQQVQLDLRSAEIDAARRETEALQAQLKELQAESTERGMVLTLGDVLFDSGEATLKPGAMRTIDKIADFMHEYPDHTVVVEGHTDSMGDEQFNQKLSENRAFAVRSGLQQRGIASHRVSTRGYGESLPIASNDTTAGRQENRRVEVIFPNLGNTRVSDSGQ